MGGLSKIPADIFYYSIRITKIRLGIDIKSLLVLRVDYGFCFFERESEFLLQFIQESSLEGFTEIGVIEIFYSTPEAIVGKAVFRKEAVGMEVLFKRLPKCMKAQIKPGTKFLVLFIL